MERIDCGCTEYNELSRRNFLGDGRKAAAAAAAMLATAWVPKVVLARDHDSARDTLVNVFLRGGADGLNLVVPHGDPDYLGARPTENVPVNQTEPLDTFFGLPRAMAPLNQFYAVNDLLIVHATGSTDPTRSHFDAQKYLEYGVPGFRDPSVVTGWLGRHLATTKGTGPLRAVALSSTLPRALAGGPQTLPIRDLNRFDLDGRTSTLLDRRQIISNAYEADRSVIGVGGLNTFDTIDLLDRIDARSYQPTVNYPTTSFARSLQSAAALIKADVGVEAIEVDLGGWDTHSTQGTVGGRFETNMATLAQGLAAFYGDLYATHRNKVTILVHSEFGRRVEENGSNGTDHGHGGCIFVMGGNVNGGRVLTQWPGLSLQTRWQGYDLDVTIDYRDLFAEIVDKRLGNGASLASVFPRHTPNYHNICV